MNKTLISFFAGVCAAGFLLAAAGAAEQVEFRSAKPVWPKDREKEMNVSIAFRAEFRSPLATAGQNETGATVLRVAGATIYRAYLNGEFLGCGPARGPHGYYRVDEWDLRQKLRHDSENNVLTVEVAGYNANSYSLLDQPSFLQAEVQAGGRVVASTEGEGVKFSAHILNSRVQKVQRYSFQRPFSEVYRLTPDSDRWQRADAAADVGVELTVFPEKPLLLRGVDYPDFTVYRPIQSVSDGQASPIDMPANPWKDRSLTGVGPKLKGYPEAELTEIPTIEAQGFAFKQTASLGQPYAADQSFALAAGQYRILDLGINRTGFLGAKVTCEKKSRLWFLFDEVLSNGDVDFKRLGCVNIISYELEPGTYCVESIEPYTLRYWKLFCVEGECKIEGAYLREYAHPKVNAQFASSDERLNRIFAAGAETFRQNSLDIFMDCPSRERAGWLCDSFFTSRAATDLTGNTRVERNMVENFCLPAQFEYLPDGMLPMCYPADHYDGVFIPNWALWFVIQLDEYHARGGDVALVAKLRPRVLKLLDFFKQYENEDGLLEKLPSWVFVEWSAANKFVQDVNYPSNMLYAGALSIAARLYDLPDLAAKADRIRETVRKQSFDGQFFVDNAVRKDGQLEVTKNRTEVCQYYAFFFKVATPESHAELWRILQDKFGPHRKETKAYPEIHPANSFIGNMLRMELLSDVGRSQQILDESIAYLFYMVERTGTLWENVDAGASCDHGFASHAVHTLYRDVLGVRRIDPVGKRVEIQFSDLSLERCEGTIPTGDGKVHLQWSKKGNAIEYQVETPSGYTVTVKNLSGKQLVRK
jgi:alpha-L-rhamnosidase